MTHSWRCGLHNWLAFHAFIKNNAVWKMYLIMTLDHAIKLRDDVGVARSPLVGYVEILIKAFHWGAHYRQLRERCIYNH